MSHRDAKHIAAAAALGEIKAQSIVGMGTGSTVEALIAQLHADHEECVFVSSSLQTTARLQAKGLNVTPFNQVSKIDVYIDGADYIDHDFCLIKGGGGALTQEKILAAGADKFVVIADESKVMPLLKDVFCPIEVLEPARSAISRQLYGLGLQVVYRPDFKTDNGHVILDVYGLSFAKPLEVEAFLQGIPGVVECGLFARHRPEQIIVANDEKARYLERSH